MSAVRTEDARLLRLIPPCGDQESVFKIARVNEWVTGDLSGPVVSVVASKYGDHVIVYEEDHEQGVVSSV